MGVAGTAKRPPRPPTPRRWGPRPGPRSVRGVHDHEAPLGAAKRRATSRLRARDPLPTTTTLPRPPRPGRHSACSCCSEPGQPVEQRAIADTDHRRSGRAPSPLSPRRSASIAPASEPDAPHCVHLDVVVRGAWPGIHTAQCPELCRARRGYCPAVDRTRRQSRKRGRSTNHRRGTVPGRATCCGGCSTPTRTWVSPRR